MDPSVGEAREVPLPGRIISMVLSLAATTVLSLFLAQRILAIRSWRRLPVVVWVVLAIYLDSYAFVVATALLQHVFGSKSSPRACDSAILLCLACYVTTKFIYFFLVEKTKHIMRPVPKPRMRSKLYLSNLFGVVGVYIVVVMLNFVFRIAKITDGWCIIGMKSLAMVPLIFFDALVNIYLTLMFLIPLKRLHSYSSMPHSPAHLRLRSVALRTFLGAVFTSLSSIVNMTVLMALDGEPAWICLMCCNSDILFSAVVIQWITSKDNAATSRPTSPHRGAATRYEADVRDSFRTSTPCPLGITPSLLADMTPLSARASFLGPDEPLDGLQGPTSEEAVANTHKSDTSLPACHEPRREVQAPARKSSYLSAAGSSQGHQPTTTTKTSIPQHASPATAYLDPASAPPC